MIRLIAIALLLLQPAPPAFFTARWDTAGSATLQWTQAGRGCIARESAIGERVFIGCYERFPATITITLGHAGPLSGDLRPSSGDVYVLTTGGQTYRAPLRARDVYLPAFR